MLSGQGSIRQPMGIDPRTVISSLRCGKKLVLETVSCERREDMYNGSFDVGKAGVQAVISGRGDGKRVVSKADTRLCEPLDLECASPCPA
jgi:hypothetical protein